MNPLFRLFGWLESPTLPTYCFGCGTALERVTEPGAGGFARETWTVLQCPNWPKEAPALHYSHVIKWGPRVGPFDPKTGKRRIAA